MKETYLFWFAMLAFLLLGCRNEDLSNNLTESKREEEFFRANLKTLSEEQKQILTYLQNENSKNNFVGSLKDKVGLPIWNNTSSTSHVGLINALNKTSESDTITVAIPLTEDKEYLSSLLTAKVVNGNVIQVSTIDNLDLYNYINNSSVSTSKRETALLNFIYADHKAFGTKQYINIPADLFPEIELRDGESKKRMNVVSISEEEEEGTSNFVAPIRICVTREVICGHCSGTVILGYHTECFTYIGEYTSGGSGGDGGAGNTGGGNEGGGGSGSGSSDCGNRGVFYRIEPEGCGGNDLPPAVQILKDSMWDNFTIDISEYEYYLSEHISITNKFNVYLTQNNNQNGANFVNWGLSLLSQNPNTTWTQFENWFITGHDPQYKFNLVKLSPQESQHLLAINNEIASSPYNEEYVRETNEAFVAFTAYADIETMTDAQMEYVLNNNCCVGLFFNALAKEKVKLVAANYKLLRKLYPSWGKGKVFWYAARETVHLLLDIAGTVPVIGEVCDITNGAIYTIEGDALNASLSYAGAIPIAGWGATGAKFAIKTIAGGISLAIVKNVDGFYVVSRNQQLFRKVLGLVKGDARIAHHIIPFALQTNPVIQKAMLSKNAFMINEALNGIPVSSAVHAGSHSNYDNIIKTYLNNWNSANPNATPDQAYNFAMFVIQKAKTAIQNNPNIKINDLTF